MPARAETGRGAKVLRAKLWNPWPGPECAGLTKVTGLAPITAARVPGGCKLLVFQAKRGAGELPVRKAGFPGCGAGRRTDGGISDN